MDELIKRSDALEAIKGVQAREPLYGVAVASILSTLPTIDAIPRDVLLKRLFPLGVPRTREEMNYPINAGAVYRAITREVE